MALHDFWCTVCGQVLPDVHVPIALGAQAGAPLHCDRRAVWIPQVGRMDLRSDSTDPHFQKFTTTDGRGRVVEIDSLHKLRQVERESEQAFRNGEGQPMVWRRYAQDGSNRDRPTLSRNYDGGEHPTEAAKRRFGPSLRRSADEPDASYGPGVNDSNASALPMAGGK